VPSLIATSDLGVDVGAPVESEVRYKQFFATGLAANHLAAQPAVRDALGVKIINDKDLPSKLREQARQKAKADEERKNFKAQSDSFNGIKLGYRSANATTVQKDSIRQTAADMGLLDQADVADDPGFLKNLNANVNRSKPENADRLARLNEFVKSLGIP
jgi:hypothetical protein